MFKKQLAKLKTFISSFKFFKKIYCMLPGKGMPRRYKYLLQAVRDVKAKKIMEIGTWRGQHALEMIEEAKKYHSSKEINYYGFDLFELLDQETSEKEFSIPPPSIKEIKNKLEKTGANIHLFRGYTKDTLPVAIKNLPKMDFIYIDGGHSIDTIETDWNYAKNLMDQKTIVIFDDYWNRENSGCKKIIEGIDKSKFKVEIMPIQDKFKKEYGILTINFAKVIIKG